MDATQEQRQAAPPPGPVKRLTLSSQDKVLGGVAGGLGNYFGIDPVIFRVGFVALAVAGGSGVLLYLVGWILLPDDDHAVEPGQSQSRRYGNAPPVVAALLLAAGSIILLGHVPFGGDGDLVWPLLLLGAGAYLWFRKPELPLGTAGPPASPPPRPGPGPQPAPVATTDPTTDPTTPIAPLPTWTPPPPAAPAPPSGPPIHSITWPVISLLLIAAGVAALLERSGAIETSVETVLAMLLTLTGLALLTSAWVGRAHGLIVVALVLGATLVATSTVDVALEGGVGDRSWTPASTTAIYSPYRLAIGEATLDLRGLDLDGQDVRIVASVGIGHLLVILPPSATVDIDARTDLGETVLFGNRDSGTDAHMEISDDDADSELADVIELDLHVGVGQVEVRRVAA